MPTSISVKKLSKQYRLGSRGSETMLGDRLIGFVKGVLTKTRREPESIWALKNVSFEVREREVIGIIGRNGAGKSTLLKLLSKITYPTSGSVKVRGRVASLLEVGTGFHEELTGRENIYLNGSILGMTKREVESKLDAIVDFSGVEKFIDTPIKRYSTGMRLRLGFAVAAHLDPDILIVDEVLAVGDAGFQKKCLSAMDSLRSGGRTVLFVSHNMAAVEHLCSRCLWIDGGEVRKDGETSDVIRAYMGTFADAQGSAGDLTAATSRRGSGEIRFTALEFLSADRQPRSVIRSGDHLFIRFHYHAYKPVSFPSFGFTLTTEMGTLVTDAGTWHHDIEIPLVSPGDGYIDLEIPCLNLLPARYFMSLWLTGTSSVPHPVYPQTGVHDSLEHGVSLEVELANIYNSGRVFNSRFGVVYFPQKWHLDGMRKDAEAPQPISETISRE